MADLLGRRGIEKGFRFSFILVLRNISYDRSVKTRTAAGRALSVRSPRFIPKSMF